MIEFGNQRNRILLVLILAPLILLGNGCVNKQILTMKHERAKGNWEHRWDSGWRVFGTLKWHKHDNSLYVNEEKGWAIGTFGKVENHGNWYHIRPIYKFTVVEPNKGEKEIVVRMGYIEHQTFWSFSKKLEGCWSHKIIFEPGSKILEETVIRDYEMIKTDIPSKCLRKSPPY